MACTKLAREALRDGARSDAKGGSHPLTVLFSGAEPLWRSGQSFFHEADQRHDKDATGTTTGDLLHDAANV